MFVTFCVLNFSPNINVFKVGGCGNIPTGDVTVCQHLCQQCNVVVFAPRIFILDEKNTCRFSCGNDLCVRIATALAGVGDFTVLLGGGNLADKGLIIVSTGNTLGVCILTFGAGV